MCETPEETELRQLLREFVPEIASGQVEVVSVAREAGLGAMVAVRSLDRRIHPVTVCVGPLRSSGLRARLGGEGASAVLWSAQPGEFVLACLSAGRPATYKTPKVVLDHAGKAATVYADPAVVSYMTGGGGLRLRLSSRLVGWDIKLVTAQSGE
jgi:N utilization substance protein A